MSIDTCSGALLKTACLREAPPEQLQGQSIARSVEHGELYPLRGQTAPRTSRVMSRSTWKSPSVSAARRSSRNGARILGLGWACVVCMQMRVARSSNNEAPRVRKRFAHRFAN